MPVQVCVYDVGCFVDVLASRSGYCVRNRVPMIAILFSSLVGMSIERLTGVSQVVGSLADVFCCELNYYYCRQSAKPLLSRDNKSEILGHLIECMGRGKCCRC